MTIENSPLTRDHERIIDDTLRTLGQLTELFDKCDRCGITPPGLRDDARYLIQQYTAIKQEFFTPDNLAPRH